MVLVAHIPAVITGHGPTDLFPEDDTVPMTEFPFVLYAPLSIALVMGTGFSQEWFIHIQLSSMSCFRKSCTLFGNRESHSVYWWHSQAQSQQRWC